jgi:predicted nucleic acid-binding protein
VSTAFADSSALVKRYADEDSADVVRGLGLLVVSALARVEVPAALWRKHRVGELAAEDASVLVAAFEAEWFPAADEEPRFHIVGVTPSILDDAARLAAAHGLRAYDAVQLASAVATRAAVPEGIVFAAFDRELRAAAAAEALRLVPMQNGESPSQARAHSLVRSDVASTSRRTQRRRS